MCSQGAHDKKQLNVIRTISKELYHTKIPYLFLIFLSGSSETVCKKHVQESVSNTQCPCNKAGTKQQKKDCQEDEPSRGGKGQTSTGCMAWTAMLRASACGHTCITGCSCRCISAFILLWTGLSRLTSMLTPRLAPVMRTHWSLSLPLLQMLVLICLFCLSVDASAMTCMPATKTALNGP